MSTRRLRRTLIAACAAAALAAPAGAVAAPQFVSTFGSFGPGLNQLSGPSGVATDAAGNVFVSDTGNNRVKKFAPTGGNPLVVTGVNNTGGVAAGEFVGPRGIAIDSAGVVYVSDVFNDRVQAFDGNLGFVRQWNGAPATPIVFPADIAVDGSGNVYVANRTGPKVMKFTSTGTFVTQWTVGGTPTGIAVASDGSILVTNQTLNTVQRFTSTGAPLTGFGTSGTTAGQFQSPAGIAVDGVGNIYVVDGGNNRIQRFRPDGTFIDQFGTAGSGSGQFSAPLGVAVDVAGNVWVADTGNHRVQRFVEAADLSAAAPANVTTTVGSTVSLSVSGANGGPGVAFGSRLNLTVPAGVAIVSATASQGSCTITGQTASCLLGAVGAAAAPSATVALRGDAVVTGNTVVTVSTPTTEGSSANNTASGQITVGAAVTPQPPPPVVTPKLSSRAKLKVALSPPTFRILGLTLSNAKGTRVSVKCTKGCSVKKTQAIRVKTTNLAPLFRGKRLRIKGVIEVRFTKPKTIGKYFRFTIVRNDVKTLECNISLKNRLTGCIRS